MLNKLLQDNVRHIKLIEKFLLFLKRRIVYRRMNPVDARLKSRGGLSVIWREKLVHKNKSLSSDRHSE